MQPARRWRFRRSRQQRARGRIRACPRRMWWGTRLRGQTSLSITTSSICISGKVKAAISPLHLVSQLKACHFIRESCAERNSWLLHVGICHSIETGEPEVALDLLSQYFRTVLIPAPSDHLPVHNLPLRREFNATLLRFRLDTQYYVELVSNQQELDALKFGQRTLWRYPEIFDMWLANTLLFASSGNVSAPDQVVPRDELKQKKNEIMEHITNVAALVAYPDPSKSSLAFLLSQSRRKELAADVNAAILQSMRFPKEPAMVTIVRQLATTSAYLVGGRASMQSSGEEARKPWRLGTFVNSEADSTQLVDSSV
ncbi:hypothetical protein DL89DRAFT_15396 [Linderina pennispora]|uniref:CRA domain-containing protein n=1 Tax=Linderina pennispora TaxID=61395 RepID=A0A1Y1WLF2_9FUNG|nr:uncharacterized protein DL89DRAFT_15396 [Linderina pennispora]ORX74400.1 hypothetical protein DL89DRAFT_15396 [Linderina pennispora]